MSRDYAAKRLAREQGIPYTEALRRVRAAAAADTAPAQAARPKEQDRPASA